MQPLRKLLLNKWFLMILAIKLIAGTLVGSDFLVKGFIPFVNYYVTSGFQNPYHFFLLNHYASAFPYPPFMLWLLSIGRLLFYPVLSQDWNVVTGLHLFVSHLPMIVADITIYVVLCRWLETKERQILWLYWASPILFFINYIHGQLDVIPMAILFLSLAALFQKKLGWAMLLLGLGLATKTHLLVVLPFIFIYLLVNGYSKPKVVLYSLLPLLPVGLSMLPFIFTSGFTQSVFGTDEANKMFLVSVPYVYNNLRLLLVPAASLILFLNFFSYKKLNQDAFLLILGLVFTIFIVFVPPMPGWFYWSIPFFVYFFAKYQDIPRISFWCMNIGYLLYAFCTTQITIAPLYIDIIFSGLAGAIIMNTIWIYRVGVKSNLEYKLTNKALVIGIGGDSGAGKNTLAQHLVDLFGATNTRCVEGDDAHKWERQDTNWQQYTHLNPKSNNLYQELQQTAGLKNGENIQRSSYNHTTGTFTKLNTVSSNNTIVYVGLHPFYLKAMRAMFDIKIYLEPDEALRRHWKIERDATSRGKTKTEVLRQIESRTADAEKYIHPQREFSDIIITLKPTEPLVAGKAPKLQLRISCDNSLHIDPLMEKINAYSSMDVEHWYEDNLEHQCVAFTGLLTATEVSTVAYQLIPNLEELTHDKPQWCADYAGIKQLFILYYHSESQRSL